MNTRIFLKPLKPYTKGEPRYIDFTPATDTKPATALINCSGTFAISLEELIEAALAMIRLDRTYQDFEAILTAHQEEKP